MVPAHIFQTATLFWFSSADVIVRRPSRRQIRRFCDPYMLVPVWGGTSVFLARSYSIFFASRPLYIRPDRRVEAHRLFTLTNRVGVYNALRRRLAFVSLRLRLSLIRIYFSPLIVCAWCGFKQAYEFFPSGFLVPARYLCRRFLLFISGGPIIFTNTDIFQRVGGDII